MLLFSQPGKISVLPALPAAWGRGSVKGLLARGAIEVSARWDTRTGALTVTLRSLVKDQPIELRLPNGENKRIELTEGKLRTITARNAFKS